MKKILVYLSLLSLTAQVPVYGADPLFAFEPEQQGMSLMAKCTLLLVIIAAGYGCNTLFKAWFGDQVKTGSKDQKKDASPHKDKKPQNQHAGQRRAQDLSASHAQQITDYRSHHALRVEELRKAYVLSVKEQYQIADDEALARRIERDDERRQGRDVERKRAACSAAPAPVAPIVCPDIQERVIAVTQQTGDDCGFHAAYNAAKDDQLSTAYLEEMRAFMRTNRLSSTALTPQDVFRLMVDKLRVNPDNFTIFPNVTQLTPEHGLIDSVLLLPVLGKDGIFRDLYRRTWKAEGMTILARALDNLRSTSGAHHDFILGNVLLTYDASTGNYSGTDSGAHWIAVRARNEGGTIVLYIKDSQQGNGGTRAMVDFIKNIIKETSTLLLKEQARLLRRDLR